MPKLSATELTKLADVITEDMQPNETASGFVTALRLPGKLEKLRDDPGVDAITSEDNHAIDLIAGLLSLFIQSGLLGALFKRSRKT